MKRKKGSRDFPFVGRRTLSGTSRPARGPQPRVPPAWGTELVPARPGWSVSLVVRPLASSSTTTQLHGPTALSSPTLSLSTRVLSTRLLNSTLSTLSTLHFFNSPLSTRHTRVLCPSPFSQLHRTPASFCRLAGPSANRETTRQPLPLPLLASDFEGR